MIKGMDNAVYASWFLSENKFPMIPFINISNPDEAALNGNWI
jgi:hypothetical protein